MSDVTDQLDVTSETGFNYDTLSRVLPVFSANPEPSLIKSLGVAAEAHREQLEPLGLSFSRKYAWGEVDVLDARIADTARLYSSLLSKTFTTVSPPC
jgi:hypothetical protein